MTIIPFKKNRDLEFSFQWPVGDSNGTSADRTCGRLLLSCGGIPLWVNGEGKGVEWTWIELLEHLAAIWPYLVYEEDIFWGTPTSMSEEQLTDFESFRSAHDLASGIQGLWMPEIVIIRSGSKAFIESERFRVQRDWSSVYAALRDMGDEIAMRLETGCPTDARGKIALEEWKQREAFAPEKAARIYLGEAYDDFVRVRPDDISLFPDRFEPSEFMAAARFSYGVLVGSDWNKLLEAVGGQAILAPLNPIVSDLEQAALEALEACPETAKPFEQGYAVATAIRARLPGVPAIGDPVVMDEVLEALGVSIKTILLQMPGLDAVAVWPPSGGVQIIVNTNGKHTRGYRGRNSTLAHELCHILIDRHRALPLVDVNGGRVPKMIEQRARAFAAELLVPQEVFNSYRQQLENADESVHSVVEDISKQYVVSNEIVARQLLNKTWNLSESVRRELSEQWA